MTAPPDVGHPSGACWGALADLVRALTDYVRIAPALRESVKNLRSKHAVAVPDG